MSVKGFSVFGSLGLGLVLFAGCAEEPQLDDEISVQERAEQPEAVPMEPVDRPDGSESAVMTARCEPGEGLEPGRTSDGSVTVMEALEMGGEYRRDVRIEGLSAGEHAWHIHSGPCGHAAAVVVPFTPTADEPGLADALTPGAGGVAEASVTVPQGQLSLDQLRSGEYSLHVHQRGGVDHGPPLACANLS
jgi:Cu/Zn superoxide dismutase